MPSGQEIDRRLDEARRRDKANREDAAEAVHAVVNKTIGVAIDQVDMAALIQRMPIDEMLESVDIGSIIRGSTSRPRGRDGRRDSRRGDGARPVRGPNRRQDLSPEASTLDRVRRVRRHRSGVPPAQGDGEEVGT